jgi:hypothetical protein
MVRLKDYAESRPDLPNSSARRLTYTYAIKEVVPGERLLMSTAADARAASALLGCLA